MTIELPKILSENIWYKCPGANASTRRQNERRAYREVTDFLDRLGFSLLFVGDKLVATRDEVQVEFSYWETVRHCYRVFRVYVRGVKRDIRVIKRMVREYNEREQTLAR